MKATDYDKEVFLLTLEEMQLYETADNMVEQVIDDIIRACNATMPRKVLKNRRLLVDQWNKEINAARIECHRTRKQKQQAQKKYYKTGRSLEVIEA